MFELEISITKVGEIVREVKFTLVQGEAHQRYANAVSPERRKAVCKESTGF
jgi:hypothetical protein